MGPKFAVRAADTWEHGAVVLVAAVIAARHERSGTAGDLVAHGLAVVVAPAAAAASAAAMRVGVLRVLVIAGIALPLALAAVMILDYAWTFALFVPLSPGPPPGTAVSPDEVAGGPQAALMTRHVVACAVGLVGGSLFGVSRASASAPVRG